MLIKDKQVMWFQRNQWGRPRSHFGFIHTTKLLGISSILLFLLLGLLPHGASCSQQLQAPLSAPPLQILAFGPTWRSLGPFRIGTREAIWGADPLERIGGFRNISYDSRSTFSSPLTTNATLTWSTHQLEVGYPADGEAQVSFNITYDNVDWTLQQQVYGFAASQYQIWVRGSLMNHDTDTRKAWVFPRTIVEFYVNDRHFFGGDFFTFNRAPVLVDLAPGLNEFNVRLFRDVRSEGGFGVPVVKGTMLVRLASTKPELDLSLATVPDIVGDTLPTRYFSVPVRNPLSCWVSIYHCSESSSNILWNDENDVIHLGPGQTRPVAFSFSDQWKGSDHVSGALCYYNGILQAHEREHMRRRISFSLVLKKRNITEASKFTYLHPSGVVSHALLKPPVSGRSGKKVPLLLVLHGAGVEVDTPIARDSLDGFPEMEAFALFPSAMSPWSGDDWHLWGSADVISAIDTLPVWSAATSWNGTFITTDRVVVIGHSNGGQGTWFWVTHFPDRIIAAAALSGYTSIENYVPFTMWRESDPLKSSILNGARGSYRHELLLENLAHMPLYQQHGSLDDNVPVYNSRLMSNLRAEIGVPSEYVEYAGYPHWWQGVITTPGMKHFYKQHLRYEEHTPVPPSQGFSIVIPSSGEIGSKFGILVDQLESPDYFGRIDVAIHHDEFGQQWQMKTTNVHRLHFEFDKVKIVAPAQIILDSQYRLLLNTSSLDFNKYCTADLQGVWQCSQSEWMQLDQRHGRQKGALDAILRSRGRFEIVTCTDHLDLAAQVSRNMYQYYGADSRILRCDQYSEALKQSGNVILLSNTSSVAPSQLPSFPITIEDDGILLVSQFSGRRRLIDRQPGLGTIFLRPLPNERLELVVWGSDADGMRLATRLVPSLTGGGQPDFIVIGPKARVQGYGGTLAMGFFDFNWNISGASYVP